MKRIAWAALAIVATVSNATAADYITATNLDTLGDFENLSNCDDTDPDYYAGPITDDFMAGATDVGDLTNCVYLIDKDIDGIDETFVYVHEVVIGEDNVSELNTAFAVFGFTLNDQRAGWSYSQAGAVGGAGTAADFDIILDDDGTIDWEQTGLSRWWDTGEKITFFFESTGAPSLGNYNIIDGQVGTATSYAPSAPEPSLLLLMGSGLLGTGLLRSRRRSSK